MSEQGQQEMFEVPLNFHVSENLVSRYATSLVVQFGRHEFILSFFEARPPILLGPLEERKAALQKLDAIQAECVARIIISPAQMPDFIKAMEQNLERYRSLVEAAEVSE